MVKHVILRRWWWLKWEWNDLKRWIYWHWPPRVKEMREHQKSITTPDKVLDYEIARRKGWRIVEEEMEWTFPEGLKEPVWRLRDPNNKICQTCGGPEPRRFNAIPGYTSNVYLSYQLFQDLAHVVDVHEYEEWNDAISGAHHWVNWGRRGVRNGGQMMNLVARNWIKLHDGGFLVDRGYPIPEEGDNTTTGK